jgi:hypothetical protein
VGPLGPFAAFGLEEAGGRRIVALGVRAEAELPPHASLMAGSGSRAR